MAQIGIETSHRRTPRDAFERGYQEFLKNYYDDHSTPRRSYYYYQDSNENDSNENSGHGDSYGSSSEEHKRKNVDKTKNYRNNKGRNKYNSARQHRDDPKKSHKKKSKHCKSEKRGNMMCSVCYDPKGDEKSESCSFNKDTKYSTKNNDNTSGEDSRSGSYEDSSSSSSNENNDSSSGEDEQNNLRKKPNPIGPYQQQNPVQYNPRYNSYRPLPPFVPRNVGPQVFPPAYNPYPRYDLNNLPPNYALVRYNPYGQRTFRLVTPPNPVKLQVAPQNNNNNNNRLRSSPNRPIPLQEMRPPRDINGAHSESQLSNITREHRMSYEYPSRHPRNHASREYSDFVNRDWTSCKKSIENQQICFECHVDGGMKKECMYSTATKPENYFKSYSKTHTYRNKYHPYEFETPDPIVSNQAKRKQKNNNAKINNNNNDNSNENDSVYYPHFSSLDSNHTDIIGDKQLHLNILDFNNNQRPQAQPLRSATDIIYGIRKPGAEPLALFFKMDHRLFDHNTDRNNDNNKKT